MFFKNSILQVSAPGLHLCQKLQNPLLRQTFSFLLALCLLPWRLVVIHLIWKTDKSVLPFFKKQKWIPRTKNSTRHWKVNIFHDNCQYLLVFSGGCPGGTELWDPWWCSWLWPAIDLWRGIHEGTFQLRHLWALILKNKCEEKYVLLMYCAYLSLCRLKVCVL